MTFKKPMRHPAVGEIRRRLDAPITPSALPARVASFAFDDALEAAVRAFQERSGLPITGEVDDATLAALRSS